MAVNGWMQGWYRNPKLQEDKTLVATQKSIDITATKTAYSFDAGGVSLDLAFTSPLLMDDLDLLARPVSYISCKVKSNDGKDHDVQLQIGASTNISVNVPSQEVTGKKYEFAGLTVLKAGTKEQPVLQKKGDNLRIDWGYMYVASPKSAGTKQYISSSANALPSFQKNIFNSTVTEGKGLVLNTVLNFGKVNGSEKSKC